MKKYIALLLAAILCFGLVACKDNTGTPETSTVNPTTSSGTSTVTPPEKSQIVISRPADSSDLDPIGEGNTNLWVFSLCLEPPLLPTEDGLNVMPGIAETWEVSPDGKTYTFHLYKDLKFSDGTPVTKADIEWSLTRILLADDNAWAELYDNWEKVECPDDQTIVVTLNEIKATDEMIFAMFSSAVTSKAHYDKVGSQGFSQGPVGTGPYMFKEWHEGEYLLLEKNPYYRFADQVKTDEIKFVVVPDDSVRIMQLQAEEVDIMTFVPYNRMDELNALDGIKAYVAQGTGASYLVFNHTIETTKDVRVRKALTMALNKEEIVQNVTYGHATVATSFLPPGVPYSIADTITVPQYDPDAAKALLADAGYPNGFGITITINAGNTAYEQMATILKGQWSKIGVDLNIVPLETGTLRPLRNNLELDLHFTGWTSDIPDPSQHVGYYCIAEASHNANTGWEDAEVEAMAKQAAVELDKGKRADLYKQIQQLYADACPVVPIYYEGYPVAMKESVTGFVQIPLGNYRFDKLAK